MATDMHFGDFNPLDVLATAAVESATQNGNNGQNSENSGENEDSPNGDDPADDDVKIINELSTKSNVKINEIKYTKIPGNGLIAAESSPHVIKLVAPSKNTVTSKLQQQGILSVKDTTKIIVPNKDGSSKTLTVLKLGKQGGADHAYSFVQQLEKHHPADDDDGYCSRSSLDSPGQHSRSDIEGAESDVFDPKSPTTPSCVLKSPTSVGASPRFTIMTPTGSTNSATPVTNRVKTAKIILPTTSNNNSPQIITVNQQVSSSKKVIVLPKSAGSATGQKEVNNGEVSNGSTQKHVLRSLLWNKQGSETGNGLKIKSPLVSPVLPAPKLSENVNCKNDSSSLIVENCDTSSGLTCKSANLSSDNTNSDKTNNSLINPAENNTDNTDQVNTRPNPNSDKILVVNTSNSGALSKEESKSKSLLSPTHSDLNNSGVALRKNTVSESSATDNEDDIIDVTSIDDKPLKTTVSRPETSNVIPLLVTSEPNKNGKGVPLSISGPIANLGVSKVITSSGITKTPITYLVVPPQKVTNGDVILTPATGVTDITRPKLQYVIQDDKLNATKMGATVVDKGCTSTTDSAPKQAWTILGAPNQKGIVLGSSVTPNHKGFVLGTSVTGPVAGSKPLFLSKCPVTSTVNTLLCVNTSKGIAAVSNAVSSSNTFTVASPAKTVIKSSAPTRKSTDKNTPVPQTAAPDSSSQDSPNTTVIQVKNNIANTSEQASSSDKKGKAVQHSDNSDHKKINIKISGSKVMDSTGTSDVFVKSKKAATSIGTVGSLSWKQMEESSTEIGSPLPGLSPSTFSLKNLNKQSGSPMLKNISPSPNSSFSKAVTLAKERKKGIVQNNCDKKLKSKLKSVSSKAAQLQLKRKGRGLSSVDFSSVKHSAQTILRLHPLIDHDYCMFQDFSADIQSSIIATTDTKTKTEKKYSKKSKSTRSKLGHGAQILEKCMSKAKKRKYTRRMSLEQLQIRRKLRQRGEYVPDYKPHGRERSASFCASDSKRYAPELRIGGKTNKVTGKREGRHYVKITGSYQDEFVYFATKKTGRNKVRKFKENTPEATSVELPHKPTAVGGISVFDWYKDLSTSDKSSRFGIHESESQPSTPVPKEETAKCLQIGDTPKAGGSTPLHDTDVVDLVMEMTENRLGQSAADVVISDTKSDTENIVVTSQSENIVDTVVSSASETVNTTISLPSISVTDTDSENVIVDSQPSTPMGNSNEVFSHMKVEDGGIDYNMMAEQVKSMLCNMDEEEIKNLEQSWDNHGTNSEGDAFHNLNEFLGDYSQESGPTLTQNTSVSFDLDDINDSDLLGPVAGGQINMLLGDLAGGGLNKTETLASCAGATPVRDTDALPSSFSPSRPANALFDSAASSPMKSVELDLASAKNTIDSMAMPRNNTPLNFEDSLDRSELFPEIPQPGGGAENGAGVTDTAVPPELTVVHMYWNDLPGLMIRGKQYVRLVDIHKQMLPAKDTGILKKRCQMMGLPIVNCTELQRDFLVRYANAAKSKSTVIASKADAEMLVSFYVDPRPRLIKHSEDSRDSVLSRDAVVQDSDEHEYTGGKGKHKPRQQAETVENTRKFGSLEPLQVNVSEKGGKRKRKSSLPEHGLVSPVTPKPDDSGDCKRSERTRNRKINYAALHSGGDGSTEIDRTSTSRERRDSRVISRDNSKESKARKNSLSEREPNNNHGLVTAENAKAFAEKKFSFPEEVEIRKLRDKQRRKPLSQKDSRILKRLRERLREKLHQLKRQLDRISCGSQDMDSSYEAVDAAMLRVQEGSEIGSHVDTLDTLEHEHSHDPDVETCDVETHDDVTEVDSEPEVIQTTITPLKIEIPMSAFERFGGSIVTEENKKSSRKNSPGRPETPVLPPLDIVHKDNSQRNGQRGKVQHGELLTHRYKSRDSNCIRCCTCGEMLGIKRFLKHMHHQNNPDELCAVTLAQKLELVALEPSEDELTRWQDFNVKREAFDEAAKLKSKQHKRSLSGNSVTIHDISDDLDKSKVQVLRGGENSVKNSRVSSPVPVLKLNSSNSSVISIDMPSPTDRMASKEILTSTQITKENSIISKSLLAEEEKVAYREECKTAFTEVTTPDISPKVSPGSDKISPSNTRHSSRVRKRKQLHPIESYVFTRESPGTSVFKRNRQDSSCTQIEHVSSHLLDDGGTEGIDVTSHATRG